jgi:hypothetical protein
MSNKAETKNILLKQNGQATLEWILASTFMMLTIGGVLALGGLLFHKHWVLYNAQKTLVCLAEGKTQSACKRFLLDRLKLSYFKSTVEIIRPMPGEASVTVINYAWGSETLKLSRSLRWPTLNTF